MIRKLSDPKTRRPQLEAAFNRDMAYLEAFERSMSSLLAHKCLLSRAQGGMAHMMSGIWKMSL